MTPYPTASPWVDFDVVEMAKNYPIQDSVTMHKDTVRKTTMTNKRTECFKIYAAMGVNEAKVKIQKIKI